MNIDDLRDRVNGVIEQAEDPEAFHGAEDDLMVKWINDRATDEEREEFKRLWFGDFTRWYA